MYSVFNDAESSIGVESLSENGRCRSVSYIKLLGSPSLHGAATRPNLMSDDLSAEFVSYRTGLRTEVDKQAFDRKIKQLLQERGVDYVRGYVDGLKDNISK